MPTDHDDLRVNHNLPVPPQAAPPPAVRRSEPAAPPPAPGASGPPAQPSLADLDRRRRWEQEMGRDLSKAEYLMQSRVKHPDGGERTVAETQADEEEQRQQIKAEVARGSLKHRPLSRWQHAIPKLVLGFDFILLLYFFAGITNVNWQSPLSASMGFAVILAAMVTVLAFGFLAYTGHQLRSYKNHAGRVHLSELDGFTMAAFGAAIVVIVVLAGLMYLRIRSEVTDALGIQTGLTALAIPLAVAVVSAAANFLVVLIHTFDGSDAVHRLNKLAAASHRLARRPAG
jgi:hypothetical protein